jgi:BirA family biotin operon repressor/biotin-[acetyl-CoA-carboxylase] ligase
VALDIKKALKKVYEINSQIKWPNDLYLNEKKFGGILIETKIVNKKLLIIVGIGLNVYMEKNDFIDQEWTSLHLESPSIEIDRNILISQIVSEIAKDLNIFLKKGFKVFKKDFEKINILKNKKVFVSNYSEENCIALDTNDDGSLNILVDNVKKRVSSGEVSLKIQK